MILTMNKIFWLLRPANSSPSGAKIRGASKTIIRYCFAQQIDFSFGRIVFLYTAGPFFWLKSKTGLLLSKQPCSSVQMFWQICGYFFLAGVAAAASSWRRARVVTTDTMGIRGELTIS